MSFWAPAYAGETEGFFRDVEQTIKQLGGQSFVLRQKISLQTPLAPADYFEGGILSALLILWGRADAEHLGPAGRAHTLSGGLAVLHGDALGIPDLLLGSALNTIGFHHTPHYD